MRRIRTMLACALALFFFAAPPVQAQRVSMLPPDIDQQYSPAWIAGYGERPLWTARAGKGYRTRLRMSLAGISLTRVSIRIDERDNGAIAGRILVGRLPRGRRGLEVAERRFPVTRAQFDALQQRIRQSRLWQTYPQYWYLSEEDNICVDGMELVMERVDAAGYRFAHANAQCGAPADMLAVASAMIDLSREPNVGGLLR